MTTSTPDRDPIFDRLADAWSRHDPAPPGLADRALRVVRAELAADPFELEYEALVLTSSSDRLVGTRGAGQPVTLQFEGEEIQLLVRVRPLSDTECRVDGWVTPGAGLSVTAVQGERRTEAVMAAPGRFEFPSLVRGPTRLLVSSGTAGPEPSRFGTVPFDL